MVSWDIVGILSVNKFPSGDPISSDLWLNGGKVYVGDGSYPENADFLGEDFLAVVYDDDGPDGMPGTLLDSLLVTVNNYHWVDFDGFDLHFDEGYFYIGMKQLNIPIKSPPIGIEEVEPIYAESYFQIPGVGFWQESPFQDFMIHAHFCTIEPEGMGLSEDDNIYGINLLSSVDPCLDSIQGNINIVGTTYNTYFTDDNWNDYTPGNYSYLISIKKDSIWDSTFYQSNIIAKNMTINYKATVINLADHELPELYMDLTGNNCIDEFEYNEQSSTGHFSIEEFQMGNYVRTISTNGDIIDTATISIYEAKLDTIYVNYTSVQEIGDEDDIVKIYPNPALNLVNVNSESPFDLLYVINLYGQIVFKATQTKPINVIDMTDLAPGFYTISLKLQDGWVNKKIILR